MFGLKEIAKCLLSGLKIVLDSMNSNIMILIFRKSSASQSTLSLAK